jgi:gliding motility-associated-like protein
MRTIKANPIKKPLSISERGWDEARLTIFTLIMIMLVLQAHAQTYFNKGKLFAKTAVSGNTKIADFNNDGNLDLIAAVRRIPISDSVVFFDLVIYKNNGDSTFAKIDTIKLGYKALYFNVGDLTRDNNLDIVVCGIDTLGNTHLNIFGNKKNFIFADTFSYNGLKKPGQILLDDFNDDGTRDIFINASLQSDTNSTIFIDSLRSFVPRKTLIPKTDQGDAINFDYDGNGWPDILITGVKNGKAISKIYMNRIFHFKAVKDSSIVPVHHSKIAVSDYNNDGEPDLAIGGITNKGDTLTTIYLRYGKRFIPFQFINLKFLPSEMVFADLDHDGNSDLLLSGLKHDSMQTKLFINGIGSPAFLIGSGIDKIPKPTLINLPDSLDFIASGDLNKDGNLDLFTGKTVYYNASRPNKRPVLIMENTQVFTFNSNTVFIWEQAKDDVTPQNSITYEFYLKKSNADYLFAPELNDTTKYRKASHVGRIGSLAYAVVRGLTNGGIYDWSAVPIDNSLHGGIIQYPISTITGGNGGNGQAQITDCFLPIKDTVLCGEGTYTFYGKKETPTLWFSMNKGLLGRQDTASYEVDKDDINGTADEIDNTQDDVFSINLVNVCDQSYDMKIKIMNKKEHYLSPSDTTICPNSNLIIKALYDPTNLKWFVNGQALPFTGKNLELNNIKQPTEVRLHGLDSDRCAYSDKMQIKFFPFAGFIEPAEVTIEQYSDTILTASGGSNYNWTSIYPIVNPFSASITVEPMDTTNFYVTANDSNNCLRADTITVNVTPFDYAKGLFIPALFTPNADGQNDLFKVYGSRITALEFSVKDRVGNTVFKAVNQTETWDGTVNGVPQPSGLYYWTLSGKYENGQEIKINHANAGAVRLVR